MVIYLEEGKTTPSIKIAEQLAGALGVSAGWLAYGQGEGPEAK